jgi:hypothetical protein
LGRDEDYAVAFRELAIVETCLKTAQRDRMTIGLTSNKQHLGFLVNRLRSNLARALFAQSIEAYPHNLALPFFLFYHVDRLLDIS